MPMPKEMILAKINAFDYNINKITAERQGLLADCRYLVEQGKEKEAHELRLKAGELMQEIDELNIRKGTLWGIYQHHYGKKGQTKDA